MEIKNKRSWGYIAGGAVALMALAGIIGMLPDIRLYFKIMSM
ncbi:MAG: hypothetical protein ACM3SR_06270 [Ignavibacteriales bacterium]|jgi:hypothetical protein